MEDNHLPKQVVCSELPHASRPTGRPKLHFRDVLKRDLNAFTTTDTSWEKLPAAKERSEPMKLESKHPKMILGGLRAAPCPSSRTTG